MGAVAEKLVLACRVTLPPGGITTLRPLKAAVLPMKGIVPKGVPLLESVIFEMPVDPVPVPVFVMVRLVKVTAEPLGLFKTT